MAEVGVIGAGSWGTALAILLYQNGHQVTLVSPTKNEEQIKEITARRITKLPDVFVPEGIFITNKFQPALEKKDAVILASPSPYTRSMLDKMKPFVEKGQKIVTVAKGIEAKTLMNQTEIILEKIPWVDAAVLSGPSHAEEVSKGLPTSCVIGAATKKTAEYLQGLFMSPTFRVYTSPDMKGIELSASMKNVIALAAGTADGLGCGDNAKAALITRGIAEIARLGQAMGCKAETFWGLSGIGDLIVTCASVHSRNRKAGYLIGKGYTMEEAMKEVNMVVEGVYSAKAGRELAQKYHVETPIIEQMNQVLFEKKSPQDALEELMMRDKKMESDGQSWN